MARTVRDAKLDTRSARMKLSPRREPYWRTISQGLAIGYRRGAKGGTWVARHYSKDDGRRFNSLGTADDIVDADSVHVLSFDQAQEDARTWFKGLAAADGGGHTGPFTVEDAIEAYLEDYSRRGGKALGRMQSNINTHILPELGNIQVSRLSRRRIENWIKGVVTKPPRLRTGKGQEQSYREVDIDDPDVIRRRQHTANKILATLKAALTFTHTHSEYRHLVPSDAAWAAVKPYRNVDVAKVRYLNDKEARKLVRACPADLAAIVTGALLTGARYSELARLHCSDFNKTAAALYISESKGGKPRHIALTDEGVKFFSLVVKEKAGDDIIFIRDIGTHWRPAHQYRPLKQACEKVGIKPVIGFHILRHTYASRLAMNAAPMAVIAQQLGHADTRITEKHYAHIAPSYVADTVRASFGEMGLVK